jgi:hypothetical protein
MKMSEVSYLQEKMELLFKFPIIKANIEFIQKDFETAYEKALDTDMPEEVPKEHLQNLKSDLFTAFCHGVRMASYTDSSYRNNFKLPKEVMDQMSKPKIITPDNDIKVPPKKIIT